MKKNNIKIILFSLVIITILLTIFFIYKIISINSKLIPVSTILIIVGLLFEGRRLVSKWNSLFVIIFGSYIFSFIAFLPGRGESLYVFEDHVILWPYLFIIWFIIITIVFAKKKLSIKLTEGVTLLQSAAIVYWFFDHRIVNSNSITLKIIFILIICFSLYSITHAMTRVKLSPKHRLVLSLWSSVIMLILAIDNIYQVYQNGQIEESMNFAQSFYIGIQYFLLGVCSIYIVQNIFMLIGYLPGKGTLFNKKYFQDINELSNEHISRYSNKQMKRSFSLFCIFFTGIIFIINYYFQILPGNIAIWLVFFIFPYLVNIIDYLSNNIRTHSYSA